MIIDWLLVPIMQPILDFFSSGLFIDAMTQVFFFEKSMGISDWVLSSMNMIIGGFASAMLTLKLLYKLFNIYILKIDGDASTNPLEYLKSYAKGVVVTLCFTVAYSWIYEVVTDLASLLLAQIGQQDFSHIAAGFSSGNLTIFMIIYLIFVCIIYIHLLMNGVRMFVLRLTIPFACTGLIDNDNGIFTVYMKKIFQTSATVVVQVLLVQISIIPVISGISFVAIMISISILAYSLKVTSDLTEIFAGSAGSGLGSKASSVSRGIGSAVKFLKK